MNIDTTLYHGRTAERRSEQEDAIYDKLEALGISFTRVDHDAANTMEDCLLIESHLGGKICKNLFLCNRQETEFYLLMMPGGKPFKTKFLSGQLGCSRLSFANADHMAELLRTIPGSVSALELLFDTENRVRLVIDRDLLQDETVSGHPGFSTSTICMTRDDMLRYVEAVGHSPTMVELPIEVQILLSSPVFPANRPPILLMSPVLLNTHVGSREDDILESEKLSGLYQRIAARFQLPFLDAARYAAPSEIDGVHLSPKAHETLGVAIAEKIKSLF